MQTICYCGKDHSAEKLGWTVIRNTAFGGPCPYKVYRRDVPANAEHFAADLAPFTFPTKREAIEQGKLGNFAYKRK